MTFIYVDTALTFRDNLQPPSSRHSTPPNTLKMDAASSSKTFVPTKHTVLSQKTVTGQYTYFNFPVFPGALLSYSFLPFVPLFVHYYFISLPFSFSSPFPFFHPCISTLLNLGQCQRRSVSQFVCHRVHESLSGLLQFSRHWERGVPEKKPGVYLNHT
jgi:hypothetical protein